MRGSNRKELDVLTSWTPLLSFHFLARACPQQSTQSAEDLRYIVVCGIPRQLLTSASEIVISNISVSNSGHE